MTETSKSLPYLRWGILATGWMSQKFVTDLLVPRPNAKATHEIVAIGSSSLAKAEKFVADVITPSLSSSTSSQQGKAATPKLYDDYKGVYANADVDIVYVGTPHSLHMRNCLDAIEMGKNVLCEKPFAINAREAEEVVSAARRKGVYVMEGLWTRFLPVTLSLQDHLFEKKTIGAVERVYVDFGLDVGIRDMASTARLKNPALGGGALLDLGIYPLTLASLALGYNKLGEAYPHPKVQSVLNIKDGVDYSNITILTYPLSESGADATAICTSTMLQRTGRDFMRVEGTKGAIVVFGGAASIPSGFRVLEKANPEGYESVKDEFTFEHPGTGWHFEADAVAVDLAEGRKENEIMPLGETMRVMRLLDEIRRVGGLVYEQDK